MYSNMRSTERECKGTNCSDISSHTPQVLDESLRIFNFTDERNRESKPIKRTIKQPCHATQILLMTVVNITKDGR